MAQPDDIALRNLVLEALEKNGSLAKIKALLRANVFLAFEDECENKKHNISLDKILNLPEGIVALSIVHEFLEYLNLKNTLFVYKAESRQGNEYKYSGRNRLADKLNISQRDQEEPILVSLIKNLIKHNPRKLYEQGDGVANAQPRFRDDQNCTYIVHEDSSATASSQSSSQSENSSDEKNRLQRRLPLDNSDTDTSNDSARDKSRSEYVPNDKIVIQDESEEENKSNTSQQSSTGAELPKSEDLDDEYPKQRKENTTTFSQYQLKVLGVNNDSDSTSYVELKPYNNHDKKMLNTTGLPIPDAVIDKRAEYNSHSASAEIKLKNDSNPDSATVSNNTSIHSLNSDSKKRNDDKETPEYSNDFTSSPRPYEKDEPLSPNSIADNLQTIDSPHQISHSTRSSVSISDVADLIELSEANSPRFNLQEAKSSLNKQSPKRGTNETDVKLPSYDSGDNSGSPIPSLSNLSLDFHSD